MSNLFVSVNLIIFVRIDKIRFDMRRFLLVLFIPLVFASCRKIPGESPEPHTYSSVVTVYITADNSLSDYADSNLQDMLSGYLPAADEGKVLLVHFHNRHTPPVLYRLRPGMKDVSELEIVCEFEPQSTSDVEYFRRVMEFVKERYVSEHYGLIMWSHSTGWLPEGYYSHGAPQNSIPSSHADIYGDAIVKMDQSALPTSHPVQLSFGQDAGGREMDIIELAAAVPMHLDFLIFDSCLMGGVEVAYQFRNLTDYMVVSPAEILANGMPYSQMMYPIFNYEPKEAMIEVAELFYDYYAHSSIPYVTVSVVDTAPIEALADACRDVFAESGTIPHDVNAVQGYFRFNKHYFYDLASFVKALEPSASSLEAFSSAMERTVIFKKATEEFITVPIHEYSGLSSYIQSPPEPYLDSYYRGLDWNKDVGMVAD